jgi:uncharacterized protein
MRLDGPACRLTVIVGESHQWHHRPVYVEIIHRAHRAGLAGASAFRGIEGFGASSRVHEDRALPITRSSPVAIVIIDEERRIGEFLPQLDEVVQVVLIRKVATGNRPGCTGKARSSRTGPGCPTRRRAPPLRGGRPDAEVATCAATHPHHASAARRRPPTYRPRSLHPDHRRDRPGDRPFPASLGGETAGGRANPHRRGHDTTSHPRPPPVGPPQPGRLLAIAVQRGQPCGQTPRLLARRYPLATQLQDAALTGGVAYLRNMRGSYIASRVALLEMSSHGHRPSPWIPPAHRHHGRRAGRNAAETLPMVVALCFVGLACPRRSTIVRFRRTFGGAR